MIITATSSLEIALQKVIQAYRLGHEGEASEQLVQLIDLLSGFLAQVPEEQLLRINPILGETLAAIERKDYLWAADLLAYELSPLLETSEQPVLSESVTTSDPTSTSGPKFSTKGQALIQLYTQMAEQGYERTDHIHVAEAFSDFELRAFRQHLQPLFLQENIKTVLDYGSGGSQWQTQGFDEESGASALNFFNLDQAYCYEPARGVDERQPVDCVISFDVLEHIFIADVPNVLRDLFQYARKLLVLNIACYPAAAKLPNGENAHITVRDPQWWKGMLDAISVEYPQIKVYLICSTAWRQTTDFPPWSAQMWHQDACFTISY